MTEQTYNKVFELIQGTLVPKSQLDEAQIKIKHLESMFETLKSDFNEQKLSVEIIQAEKDSLQGEKESLQAGIRAIELKFKEVSLKLKQKTDQYDSLSKFQADREQNKIEKSSTALTGGQKVKDEPREIGIVNVPASTSSKPKEPARKTGTKRQKAPINDFTIVKAKRKKVEKSNTDPLNTRKSTNNKLIFTCYQCLKVWGTVVENSKIDLNETDGPDPKQKIQKFSSFETYKIHLCEKHDYEEDEIFQSYRNPNNDFVNRCKICDCRFGSRKALERHTKFEHANPNMTNGQYYQLYLECTLESTFLP